MVFVNWWKIQSNSGNCFRKGTYYMYSTYIVVLIENYKVGKNSKKI